MDRRINLTIGQLLSSLVTIVIVIFAAWVSITGRVKALEVSSEIRFKQIEKTQGKTDSQFEKILDELSDIKVAMENKADKK